MPTHYVERYGSVEDAAAHFKVSRKTIRRWIAEGRITGYRVGPRYIRVDLDEIETSVVRRISGGHNAA